jgi:hypothetical protein
MKTSEERETRTALIKSFTREEYIALKVHLAWIRGYQVGTGADAVAMLMKSEALRTAMSSRPRCGLRSPGTRTAVSPIVVYQSDQFDASLNEMTLVVEAKKIKRSQRR